eukprot:NODE_97_length_3300_cov_31.611504_g88_i0.p1 GENE.NODE_97_length_3300_cov_31.611504_g88_i0~~NODE_97_length_3300_cov_31.611504_g88_i0.p1  ORF type:complete len:988 (+),score=176.17 NODE_97_length_3300_cov_31.611504_g88_i0:110-3073(+)
MPEMLKDRSFGMYQQEVKRPTRQLRNGKSWADVGASAPSRSEQKSTGASAVSAPSQNLQPSAMSRSSVLDASTLAHGSSHLANSSSVWEMQQAPTVASTQIDAPEGRSRTTVVFHEHALYVFGGAGMINSYTGNRLRNDTFYYRLKEREWHRLECTGHFPKARALHTAIVKDHKMVVYGGLNEDGLFLNDMFALSLNEDPHTWKKVAVHVAMAPVGQSSQVNAPPFLCSHSAVLHLGRNSMVVFGGKTPEGISSQIYEFSFSTQEWTRLGSPPSAVSVMSDPTVVSAAQPGPLLFGHTASIHGNLMYVSGGYTYHQGNHHTYNNLVFAFDFNNSLWYTVFNPSSLESPFIPPPPQFLAYDRDTQLLWTCGANPCCLPLNPIDMRHMVWEPFDCDEEGDEPPVMRELPAVIVSGRLAFVFGGERYRTMNGKSLEDSRVFFNDLYCFELKYTRWRCYSPLGHAQSTGSDMPRRPQSQALSPIQYQNAQQKINLEMQSSLKTPLPTAQVQIGGATSEKTPAAVPTTKKSRPPVGSQRVVYCPPESPQPARGYGESNIVPIWKRDTKPKRPDIPPEYKQYYSQSEPKKKAVVPSRSLSPAGMRPPASAEEEPAPALDEAAQAALQEQTQQLQQLLSLQQQVSSRPSAKGGGQRSAAVQGTRSQGLHPDSLSVLLSGSSPTGILHSLLNEKYQFDKEKEALAAASPAAREEVTAYERLLDHVIAEYIAKTNAIHGAGGDGNGAPAVKRQTVLKQLRAQTEPTRARSDVSSKPSQLQPAKKRPVSTVELTDPPELPGLDSLQVESFTGTSTMGSELREADVMPPEVQVALFGASSIGDPPEVASIKVIQSAMRSKAAETAVVIMRDVTLEGRAATKIQAIQRGRIARKMHAEIAMSAADSAHGSWARVIQAAIRAVLASRMINELRSAAEAKRAEEEARELQRHAEARENGSDLLLSAQLEAEAYEHKEDELAMRALRLREAEAQEFPSEQDE